MTSSHFLAAALLLVGITSAAADCANPSALGTSRTLVVDPSETPRIGLKSFAQTLPLADREVVLTFDDGPFPPLTRRVLDVLAQHCVRATFFLVGGNAAAHPALVRRMAAEGHTIAHHSWSHRILSRIPFDAAVAEIDRGIAADVAAGGGAGVNAAALFRFPGFASTPALLDHLEQRGIAVVGADLWASDWNPMTPAQQFDLVTARLKAAGRGIILFHDIRAQTVAMLPDFLRHLRANGYRVVHIVGKATSPENAVRKPGG